MPEPRYHYQLSFTSRQAVGIFAGLLVALGLAYFFGLMTGLAGRGPKTAVETTPSPAPTEPQRIAAVEKPTPIRPLRTTTSVPPFPKPVLGTQPTTAPSLEFFEDRPEGTPASRTRPPAVRSLAPRASPPSPAVAAPGGEFWIQVLSLSSEAEARARRDKLISRGYRARVEIAQGPKGTVYRVRVGPYTRREEAERASERLSKEEKVRAWIAPAGK